jgi:hypothetical protein
MAYGWIDIEVGKIHDAIPELRKAKAMESPRLGYRISGVCLRSFRRSGPREAERGDLKRRSLHGHVLPFNLALVYIWVIANARWVTWNEPTPPIHNG